MNMSSILRTLYHSVFNLRISAEVRKEVLIILTTSPQCKHARVCMPSRGRWDTRITINIQTTSNKFNLNGFEGRVKCVWNSVREITSTKSFCNCSNCIGFYFVIELNISVFKLVKIKSNNIVNVKKSNFMKLKLPALQQPSCLIKLLNLAINGVHKLNTKLVLQSYSYHLTVVITFH